MQPFIVKALTVLAVAMGSSPASAYTLSGTYYEDQATKTCNGGTNCQISFPLPSATAGQFVNVRFVSCEVSTAQTISGGVVFISDGAGQNVRRRQALAVAGNQVGQLTTFRNEIEMKVTGGPPREITVSLYAASSTSWTVGCSITGSVSPQ